MLLEFRVWLGILDLISSLGLISEMWSKKYWKITQSFYPRQKVTGEMTRISEDQQGTIFYYLAFVIILIFWFILFLLTYLFWFSFFRDWAGELISGRSAAGRVLVRLSLVWFVYFSWIKMVWKYPKSLVYFLYLYLFLFWKYPKRFCAFLRENIQFQWIFADLVCFLARFLLLFTKALI